MNLTLRARPFLLPRLFALLTLLSGALYAAVATAPAHIATEIQNARLAGEGRFTWFGLSIYDAQLWVGTDGYQAVAPTAMKFAIDLRYKRNLVGKKIADSSSEEIKNLGIGSPEQHQKWREQMARLFPDVGDGTHITGVYLPNEGARFYIDGKMLGEIPDPDFGKAFFAIWLDSRTSAPKLRAALLAHASSNRP